MRSRSSEAFRAYLKCEFILTVITAGILVLALVANPPHSGREAAMGKESVPLLKWRRRSSHRIRDET